MCWNHYVSINTFVFGIFGLIFIAFNNKYSNYKLDFFNNSYAYLFMLSIIFMQLFEFILWRNLDNQIINHTVSIFGLLLLFIQPITSLLLINNIPLRNQLLLTYSIPALIFIIYNILSTNIHTTVSSCGHLAWNWISSKNLQKFLVISFYLFFLFFSLLYNKCYASLLFLLIYIYFIYYFGKDGSSGSIWCLSVNLIILYFLLRILIIMPYNEIINNSYSNMK
jgi:hypothetical protein